MDSYVFLISLAVVNVIIQYKKNILLLNVMLAIALFVFSAFRGEYVGSDTSTYLMIYNSDVILNNYKSEYLFFSVVKIIRDLGGSAVDCQIIMSALTFIPLVALIVAKSEIPSLSLLLFVIAINSYYFETYNIVRQLIATPYLLWAYVTAMENKWKYTILLFVVAIGFHTTSLIYLFIFLFAIYFKFSYKGVFLSVACSLVFAFAFSNITYLTDIISKFENVKLLGLDKYSYFSDYGLDLVRTTNGLITLLLPHSFLCLYAYKKKGDNLLLRLYFYGVIFLNVVSIMPTSYRMAYGLTVLELLIFPMIYKEYKESRFLFIILFIMMLVYKVRTLVMYGVESDLIPYSFTGRFFK